MTAIQEDTYALLEARYEGGFAKITIKVGNNECRSTAKGGTEADALVRAFRQVTNLYIRLKEFGTPRGEPAWVEISIKNSPLFKGEGDDLATAYVVALNKYEQSKTMRS